MKKWYIRLDTQKQRDSEIMTMIKQDIYSNELFINLVNNGVPMDLRDTATVGIVIDKADATEVIGSCRLVDIDRGLIAYVVDYQAITAIGLNTFTVKIVYAESSMTTTSFIVNVIDDPFAGTNGSIVSSSEYPILTGMMQENTEIKNAELIRVANEIDRIEKENNRVISFTTMQTEVANAELLKENLINVNNEAEATKGDLILTITNAEGISSNLIINISDAENINNIISDPVVGAIKKATDSNSTLSNTIAQSITKNNELEDTIIVAEDAKATLQQTKTLADNSNSTMQNNLVTANNLALLLIDKTATGTTINDALAITINDAAIAVLNLDQSMADATSLNSNLRDSITTAITTKSGVDVSINVANVLKGVLDELLIEGSTLNDDLELNIDGATSLRDNLILEEQERVIAEDGRVVAAAEQAAAEAARVIAETGRAAELASKASQVELDEHKLEYAQQKQLPHYNHAMQEYVNMDKYWDALRDGRIYTTEFNQFSVSPLSAGVKKDDNIDKVVVPSTNTVAGRDDYNKIGLFKAIDVNAYVDANDNYHVKAIKGDGKFKKDGTMGDVYVMAMTGYQKRYSTPTTWGFSYSDAMHAGFEVIDEAIKPDGTIRPYLLHAKYVAGKNPLDGKMASISGVYAEFANMSHNGQITEFKSKGVQYSGKTSHDDYYVQLMSWLKYATLNQENIMRGCINYSLQYVNLVPEIGVSRIVITTVQAGNLVVGSTVSIGDFEGSTLSADRAQPRNTNRANRVNITSIVDLGNGNSAVNVNSPVFNTTLTTTIITYPWNSGGCDNVLGVDGSPTNNTSGKEPFVISGIEMMVGGWEILQNLIILNNAVDNRIDVYANYDCMTYATSITSAYDLVGQLAQTNNTWRYGSKIVIPSNHPSIMLITETNASSTTGTGDAIYTNVPSAGGTRAWLSLGSLSSGAVAGLRYLNAATSLTPALWYILGRLSATGRSRRRAGVN